MLKEAFLRKVEKRQARVCEDFRALGGKTRIIQLLSGSGDRKKHERRESAEWMSRLLERDITDLLAGARQFKKELASSRARIRELERELAREQERSHDASHVSRSVPGLGYGSDDGAEDDGMLGLGERVQQVSGLVPGGSCREPGMAAGEGHGGGSEPGAAEEIGSAGAS